MNTPKIHFAIGTLLLLVSSFGIAICAMYGFNGIYGQNSLFCVVGLMAGNLFLVYAIISGLCGIANLIKDKNWKDPDAFNLD